MVHMQVKSVLRIVISCLFGVALGGIMSASADEGQKDIVLPFKEAKFSDWFTDGKFKTSVALLWKEPVSGQSSGMVKFKGVTNYHYHMYDEQVIVIKGQVVHYTDSIPDADKKPLGPGSYWYEVAGIVHQDRCLSEECMLFVMNAKAGETKEGVPARR